MHPLAVVLALAAGAMLAGIVGALLAVPLVASLNSAINYLVDRSNDNLDEQRRPGGARGRDGASNWPGRRKAPTRGRRAGG